MARRCRTDNMTQQGRLGKCAAKRVNVCQRSMIRASMSQSSVKKRYFYYSKHLEQLHNCWKSQHFFPSKNRHGRPAATDYDSNDRCTAATCRSTATAASTCRSTSATATTTTTDNNDNRRKNSSSCRRETAYAQTKTG